MQITTPLPAPPTDRVMGESPWLFFLLFRAKECVWQRIARGFSLTNLCSRWPKPLCLTLRSIVGWNLMSEIGCCWSSLGTDAGLRAAERFRSAESKLESEMGQSRPNEPGSHPDGFRAIIRDDGEAWQEAAIEACCAVLSGWFKVCFVKGY